MCVCSHRAPNLVTSVSSQVEVRVLSATSRKQGPGRL